MTNTKTANNLEGLADKDPKSEDKDQQKVLPQGDAADVEVKGVDMVQNLMDCGLTKEEAEKMAEKDKENTAAKGAAKADAAVAAEIFNQYQAKNIVKVNGEYHGLVDKDAFMKDHLLPLFNGNQEEAEQMWEQLKPRSKADVFVAKAKEIVEEVLTEEQSLPAGWDDGGCNYDAARNMAKQEPDNVIPLPHPELLLNIPAYKVAWAYFWLPDKKTCMKFQLFPAMLANKVRNHVEKLCGSESKGYEVWVDPGWLGDGPVLLDPWKSFGDQGLTSNFVLQVVEIGGDPNRPVILNEDEASPPSPVSTQPPSDDEEEQGGLCVGCGSNQWVLITLRLVYDKVVDGAARGTRSGKNLGVTVTEVTVRTTLKCGLLLTTVSSLSGVAAERLALFYKGQQVLSVNKTFEELGAVDGDQFQVALARGI